MKKKIFYQIILILFGIFNSLFSQNEDSVAIIQKYQFLNLEYNRIENVASLNDFYSKVKQNQINPKSSLSILFIGDSHIESGHQQDVIKTCFANDGFGNLNYGLVMPRIYKKVTKLMKVPIKSHKKRKQYKRKTVKSLEMVKTSEIIFDKNAQFIVKAIYNKIPYEFDRISILVEKNINSYDLEISDNNGRQIAYSRPSIADSLNQIITIDLPEIFTEIKIKTVKTNSIQNYCRIYGISLEKKENGFTFHNYGINGIAYSSYVRNDKEVTTKLNGLLENIQPDLIMIALGTNDGHTRSFDPVKFEADVNTMVDNIKRISPNSNLLLMTPPDSYIKKSRRKRVDNVNMNSISNILVNISRSRNIACWDFYSVLGGQNAIVKLVPNSLVGSDLIHLTKPGYQLQATLFYLALKRGFDEYTGN